MVRFVTRMVVALMAVAALSLAASAQAPEKAKLTIGVGGKPLF